MVARSDQLLDRAIEELKQFDGGAVLSADARDRIVRGAYEVRRPSPLAVLFPSVWRMALAGAVPLVLTAALVAAGTWHAAPAREGMVQIAKQGDRIVFRLDPSREHVVTKSGVPHHFDASRSVQVTGGSFTDRAGTGPDLVFYRID